jgi:hypothetical protein
LRNIGVNDDRVHWDIRQIASLISPGEGVAAVSTAYLENVPWRSRRICVKAANRRVPNRQIRGEIDRDAKDGTIGQNGIVVCDIHPDRLARDTGAEVKADPCVGVVGADHGSVLIFRRVLYLIDE